MCVLVFMCTCINRLLLFSPSLSFSSPPFFHLSLSSIYIYTIFLLCTPTRTHAYRIQAYTVPVRTLTYCERLCIRWFMLSVHALNLFLPCVSSKIPNRGVLSISFYHFSYRSSSSLSSSSLWSSSSSLDAFTE